MTRFVSHIEDRHPLGLPQVAPIGSNTDYATDVQHGLRFMPLIEAGVATDLPELAIRFAISNSQLPTTEIGVATIDEVRKAATAVNRGPLATEALDWIKEIQRGLAD